jgi:hypothetical protein
MKPKNNNKINYLGTIRNNKKTFLRQINISDSSTESMSCIFDALFLGSCRPIVLNSICIIFHIFFGN